MPLNRDLISTVCSLYKENYDTKYNNLMLKIKEYDRLIKFYGILIIENKDKFYPSPIIDDIENCILAKKPVLTRKVYLKMMNVDNNIHTNFTPMFCDPKNRDVIIIYLDEFIKHYHSKIQTIKEISLLNKIKPATELNLQYFISRYYFYVQQSLLYGERYRLGTIQSSLFIYGKSRRKKRYNNVLLRKTEDWGASLRYLKQQAETINPEAYNLYSKKYISKSEFLQRMRPFLYNKLTNPNGLRWIIYCNKEFDHWVIFRHTYASNKMIRMYSIIPSNYINHTSKSQIDFTNNCKSVDDIITTEMLGFRDKLRGLERFDINFCLNTYKNDLQYN